MAWKDYLRRIGLWLLDLSLITLFKAIDTDGDGKLSRKEIIAFGKLVDEKVRELLSGQKK